ncbi:3-hydroxyisobutyrate dehydrogenase [Saccharopolyspora kobensis]|uniref:3-hydroxyisobutyrate dehydrogenase n=2 Tax=Saccharopolyspora kobensis TaxID=146035 RepID=A0A1H5TN97_9PSEU|nr:NAD(P)-binding domain-containing protein [Saccharopolyspora kobensis]SEF63698.1 3-hydroxyisobutyrate dehydrogenase [Saccharopolyspora kobensis]SFC44841.1 3-hydroxyisobutyrate dehydrogenase [Saccharopolyspora kobensis]
MNQKAVSVLGLGDMGTALADALLAAGHRVTVWNRTAARAEPLVARGASRAETAADAIVASQLVVICLLDYDSVGQVLVPHTDVLAGRTLVNLTNGTPSQAREMAAWATEHGADYLDGGIMAVPPMIATPEAFVLYSGPSGTFETWRPVLDAFGESHHLGADPGLAALHDIALLNSMYGMFGGVLHAYALVRSAGGSAAEFAPMARRYVETMGAYAEAMAARIDAGDYADDVTSNLAMQTTAYANFLTAAEESGISTELITPIYSLLQRRVADGHGHEDTASLVELLATPRAG